MPSKWGQEAKKFLEDLIDSNKELFFIEDYGADKYGRLLADWFIGSRELNIQVELLRQGLAWDLLPLVRYNLPKRGILLCCDILMAQYEAYQGNLGIWGDKDFVLPGVRRLF
ncbi:thermonuclease family protein [Planktothrix agardhii 1027]|nr:thermonuclease family protein [Planktothrix agardhii 1027]MCF3647923.1 thermonuclease family protein [Planktothrix agardhii 1026]